MILTNICNKLSITLNSTKKVKQFEDGLRYKVQKLRINWTLLNIFFFCISYLKYKNNPPNIVQNKMKVRKPSKISKLILKFFHEFHNNGRLVKGVNCTFIVLIPKIEVPLEIVRL
jgi:hypothetical protein